MTLFAAKVRLVMNAIKIVIVIPSLATDVLTGCTTIDPLVESVWTKIIATKHFLALKYFMIHRTRHMISYVKALSVLIVQWVKNLVNVIPIFITNVQIGSKIIILQVINVNTNLSVMLLS